MHFVMHAFNNHVKVLNNVTPLAQLKQVAVLSDGAVSSVTTNLGQALDCPTYIPMLRFCTTSH